MPEQPASLLSVDHGALSAHEPLAQVAEPPAARTEVPDERPDGQVSWEAGLAVEGDDAATKPRRRQPSMPRRRAVAGTSASREQSPESPQPRQHSGGVVRRTPPAGPPTGSPPAPLAGAGAVLAALGASFGRQRAASPSGRASLSSCAAAGAAEVAGRPAAGQQARAGSAVRSVWPMASAIAAGGLADAPTDEMGMVPPAVRGHCPQPLRINQPSARHTLPKVRSPSRDTSRRTLQSRSSVGAGPGRRGVSRPVSLSPSPSAILRKAGGVDASDIEEQLSLLQQERAQLEAQRAELARQRADFEQERNNFESRKLNGAVLPSSRATVAPHGLSTLQPVVQVVPAARPVAHGGDTVLQLNVGSENVMAVNRSTLCAITGSRLADMFAPGQERVLPHDASGRICVDCRPDVFVHLLDVLKRCQSELGFAAAMAVSDGGAGRVWNVPLPKLDDRDQDEAFIQAMHRFGLWNYVKDGKISGSWRGVFREREEDNAMGERRHAGLSPSRRSPSRRAPSPPAAARHSLSPQRSVQRLSQRSPQRLSLRSPQRLSRPSSLRPSRSPLRVPIKGRGGGTSPGDVLTAAMASS
eukprot:TRINITY_DN18842_c1_g4_i2.p1 TRINITY_DN18842_c1_g4~~TRINITY_DN18842_c1_g4_i2.p1  ORF type:complete len:584 (-),score=78.43 TRINITY_DN18842_c1_g4_i2:288-2039(-)